jgi:diadenosine tetraphosphate (Ap4A) HIT family hydrolase
MFGGVYPSIQRFTSLWWRILVAGFGKGETCLGASLCVCLWLPILMNDPGFPVVTGCAFCDLPFGSVVEQNQHAVAFRDRYPIAAGHTLVIPRRHVESPFDLTAEELAGVWNLVAHVRRALDAEFAPDAFTIGVNDGAAAGQTIMHAHVHVIPRRVGDVADPRGGIRWVIPARAPYWDKPAD